MKVNLKTMRRVLSYIATILQIVLCAEVIYLLWNGISDFSWHWSYLAAIPLAVFVFWPVGRGRYVRHV